MHGKHTACSCHNVAQMAVLGSNGTKEDRIHFLANIDDMNTVDKVLSWLGHSPILANSDILLRSFQNVSALTDTLHPPLLLSKSENCDGWMVFAEWRCQCHVHRAWSVFWRDSFRNEQTEEIKVSWEKFQAPSDRGARFWHNWPQINWNMYCGKSDHPHIEDLQNKTGKRSTQGERVCGIQSQVAAGEYFRIPFIDQCCHLGKQQGGVPWHCCLNQSLAQEVILMMRNGPTDRPTYFSYETTCVNNILGKDECGREKFMTPYMEWKEKSLLTR